MLSTIGQSRISQLATAGEANDAQKILEETDRAIQSEGWHFNIFYDVELVTSTATIVCSVSGSNVTTATDHYLNKRESVVLGGDLSTGLTISSITSPTVVVTNVAGAAGSTLLIYSKRIETPATALNVDFSTYRYATLDPVVRGRFIYDKNNATYEFNDDLKAIITYQVPFEQATAGGEAMPEYARRYITAKAARVFAARHVGDPQLVQMAAQDEREAHAQFLQAEAENAETNVFNSALPYHTIARGKNVQVPAISNLYKS